MNSKKDFGLGILSGAVVMLLVVVIAFALLMRNGVIKTGNSLGKLTATEEDEFAEDTDISERVQEKLTLLSEYIDQLYLYDDVDENALIEGIYKGYIEALGDPYSAYYTAEEGVELTNTTSGTFGGVGVEVVQDADTNVITVSVVREDSPAEEAGAQMGDILVAVDGVEVTDMDLDSVVALVRGDVGTDVTITVQRDGQYIDMTMTRAIINTTNVSYTMMDDNIGYIYITKFVGTAADELQEALDDLSSQGMEKVIIDVRSNPGGSLDVIIDCCDIFLEDGKTIVKVTDKKNNTTEYTATGDAQYNIPMVVLTNEYTASAAELFTLALKDYGLATVVGNTTYGKGVVQQTFDLGDDSLLKITVEYYYGPNDDCIQDIGVEPDYKVEYEVTDTADSQYDKAVEILKQG